MLGRNSQKDKEKGRDKYEVNVRKKCQSLLFTETFLHLNYVQNFQKSKGKKTQEKRKEIYIYNHTILKTFLALPLK